MALLEYNPTSSQLASLADSFDAASRILNRGTSSIGSSIGLVQNAWENTQKEQVMRDIINGYNPNDLESYNNTLAAIAKSRTGLPAEFLQYLNNDLRSSMNAQLDKSNLSIAKRAMDAYQNKINTELANANIAGTKAANKIAQEAALAQGIRSDAIKYGDVDPLLNSASQRDYSNSSANLNRAKAAELQRAQNEADILSAAKMKAIPLFPTHVEDKEAAKLEFGKLLYNFAQQVSTMEGSSPAVAMQLLASAPEIVAAAEAMGSSIPTTYKDSGVLNYNLTDAISGKVTPKQGLYDISVAPTYDENNPLNIQEQQPLSEEQQQNRQKLFDKYNVKLTDLPESVQYIANSPNVSEEQIEDALKMNQDLSRKQREVEDFKNNAPLSPGQLGSTKAANKYGTTDLNKQHQLYTEELKRYQKQLVEKQKEVADLKSIQTAGNNRIKALNDLSVNLNTKNISKDSLQNLQSSISTLSSSTTNELGRVAHGLNKSLDYFGRGPSFGIDSGEAYTLLGYALESNSIDDAFVQKIKDTPVNIKSDGKTISTTLKDVILNNSSDDVIKALMSSVAGTASTDEHTLMVDHFNDASIAYKDLLAGKNFSAEDKNFISKLAAIADIQKATEVQTGGFGYAIKDNRDYFSSDGRQATKRTFDSLADINSPQRSVIRTAAQTSNATAQLIDKAQQIAKLEADINKITSARDQQEDKEYSHVERGLLNLKYQQVNKLRTEFNELYAKMQKLYGASPILNPKQ